MKNRVTVNIGGIEYHLLADDDPQYVKKTAELVDRKLSEGLSDIGGCTWSKPRGGVFVSFNAPTGCAKRIVELAKDAGVTMTGAGATWPYKQDPADSNIRIAPSLPPVEELDAALDVFVCCVKLTYAEKLLQD